MAYTPLKITIPEPCHEDWGKMKPVPGTTARHCASCVKNVVDFTGFTDAQMHAYVREHPGKLCGRFRPDQLDRPLRAAVKPSSNPLRIAATAAGLMLAATGCEKNIADHELARAVPEPTEWVEVIPPRTGGITIEDVPEEEVIEITVPSLMQGVPIPSPPPLPPPVAEEIDFTIGDIDYLEPDVPEPPLTGEIIPVPPPPPLPPPPPVIKGGIHSKATELHAPTPPVCRPAGPDLPWALTPTPDDGMMLGMVSLDFREPTGIHLFMDTITGFLPTSHKPTIEQTSHPKGVRHRILRPRPNTLPPHLANISLFPNPFVDKINLEIDAPKATQLRIVLLDASGRRVYGERWKTRPGYNTLILSPPQQRLQGSLFYVQVTDKLGNVVTKPIVRR